MQFLYISCRTPIFDVVCQIIHSMDAPIGAARVECQWNMNRDCKQELFRFQLNCRLIHSTKQDLKTVENSSLV